MNNKRELNSALIIIGNLFGEAVGYRSTDREASLKTLLTKKLLNRGQEQ